MNNKIIIVALLTLFTISGKAQTKVIAHRGFSEIAPENTMIAFQKAIEIGADYFELDVHQTKDSVLVVIHDNTVNRTSSNHKTGKIIELYLDEIQKVRVGYSEKFDKQFPVEKIPTLKEALQLAKGKIKVCVELKADGIVNEVDKLIRELDMVEEVIIFSFNDKSLSEIKELNPKLKTLLLRNYANLETLDLVKQINADAIGVGYDTHLNEEFVAEAHGKGIEVCHWTVNKEDHMKKLIDLNIDGIITNRPDLALKLN